MQEKPVIVVIRMDRPAVVGEFEPSADAILADFGVSKQAVFDILTGKTAPCGKLPVPLPADMETVETHCEDRTDDITPYTDSCGSSYDIGFGLCLYHPAAVSKIKSPIPSAFDRSGWNGV